MKASVKLAILALLFGIVAFGIAPLVGPPPAETSFELLLMMTMFLTYFGSIVSLAIGVFALMEGH